ncbi:MAG: 3-carboxy-cis,cis-muconate cycloisomerase [Alphaproteobacteria bacterium]
MSALHDAAFGAPAMAALFDDVARVQAMLDFEAALARVEGRLGVIPAAAADAIEAQCRAELYDLPALYAEMSIAGNPAIPLVKHLTSKLEGEAARVVHWGGTSQDVMDTGLALQMRGAFDLLETQLAALADAAARLARDHRDTPMVGRTLLQQALPITFGLKAARWLDLAVRQVERLRALRAEAIALQFGGAAGTLASLGAEDGLKIMAALAAELDLPEPVLPWHAERDRIGAVAGQLGSLAGSMAKIARDLTLMMQTEVAEAFEAPAAGKGGSSTLPHKRNPVDALFALAAARQAVALVPAVQGAAEQEHERAAGAWHAEWIALPALFIHTSGAVARVATALATLEVDTARMARNLDLTQGLVLAEAAMMALAPHLGRPEAKKVVEAGCRAAQAEDRHLKDVLAEVPEVAAALSPEALAACFDPLAYQGAGAAFIDRALAHYAKVLPAAG